MDMSRINLESNTQNDGCWLNIHFFKVGRKRTNNQVGPLYEGKITT